MRKCSCFPENLEDQKSIIVLCCQGIAQCNLRRESSTPGCEKKHSRTQLQVPHTSNKLKNYLNRSRNNCLQIVLGAWAVSSFAYCSWHKGTQFFHGRVDHREPPPWESGTGWDCHRDSMASQRASQGHAAVCSTGDNISLSSNC